MGMAEMLPFFDPDKARGGSDRPDVGRNADVPAGAEHAPAPLSVSALLAQIKNALTEAFAGPMQVVGEISNCKRHTSGHLYFRLKDANASIDVAMFRPHAQRLRFAPTDGLEVVVEGRIDVYDVRGQLQLYAERLTPKGAGALELAFRQLREKLQNKGLFDPQHKKPIVRFPRAVGVITSATGAAIRDIRRTLRRRWPAAEVYLFNVHVQGEGASEEITQAIRLLDHNAARYGIETLILARGGGSLEDLWAFNEECVARAIFAAETPILCGVGHEIDITIADLVADLRAATPTAAAELATPNAADVQRYLAEAAGQLRRRTEEFWAQAQASLQSVLRSVVFRDPTSRLRIGTQRLDELSHRLRAAAVEGLGRSRLRLEPSAHRLAGLHPARLAERAGAQLDQFQNHLAWSLGRRCKHAGDALAEWEGRLRAVPPRHRIQLAQQQLTAASRQLEAMSYRNVLRRGFSVTRNANGDIVRSVATVQPAERVETELTDGTFTSVVDTQTTPKIALKQSAARKTSDQDRTSTKKDHVQPSLFDG